MYDDGDCYYYYDDDDDDDDDAHRPPNAQTVPYHGFFDVVSDASVQPGLKPAVQPAPAVHLVPPIMASYQPAPIGTGSSNTGTDASGVDTGSAKPTPEPSTKPEPTPPSTTRAKRHLPQPPRPPGRLPPLSLSTGKCFKTRTHCRCCVILIISNGIRSHFCSSVFLI